MLARVLHPFPVLIFVAMVLQAYQDLSSLKDIAGETGKKLRSLVSVVSISLKNPHL
jgi:hypothetical protein